MIKEVVVPYIRHPGSRYSHDDRSLSQRGSTRQMADNLTDSPYHVTGGGFLFHLAIDPSDQIKSLWIRN